MTTITKVAFDPGTMSAPAFFDIWLENGEHVMIQGKAAKKAALKYKEGDDYDKAS